MTVKLYHFGNGQADGSKQDIALLGGKGAHLAEMSKMGIPVPPGFTVPTEYCVAYQTDPDGVMYAVMKEVWPAYTKLATEQGLPFLVSVRSGAPISMPGMMDTILNVGLTADNLQLLAEKIGERSAWDCYRRLIQMMGATAYGVPSEKFEEILTRARFKAKVQEDRGLTVGQLQAVAGDYLNVFRVHTGRDFPQNVEEQLEAAVRAVFGSWMNDRAIAYRDMQKIDHNMGTAVTVQAMVFGNFNDDSGSGVLFTRNPSNGQNDIFGEFLPNAQGEDVVAGVRTPLPLSDLNKAWPEVGAQIAAMCAQLEKHYGDMMDVEFTVQDKKLYLLQCRIGKRSPLAKAVIAADMFVEGLMPAEKMVSALTKKDLKDLLIPSVDPGFKVEPSYQGLPANNGVVKGRAVMTSDEAVQAAAAGENVILVRHETDPDDIMGMNAAIGILTKTGGATSHAAVVARAINKPCVVGCTSLPDDLSGFVNKVVTIDGATGRVWLDVDVPVSAGGSVPQLSLIANHLADADMLTEASPFTNGYCTPSTVPAKDNHIGLLVDLRSYTPSGDDELEAFFPAPVRLGSGATFDQSKVEFLVPPADVATFQGLGFKVANTTDIEVHTLDALLDKKSLKASPALVKKLGASTFDKLKAALKAAGFAESSRTVYPAEYILFQKLTEG
jgi:pyruvate,orthophosphate dikinase